MPGKKDDYLEQMKKQYDELNYRWSRERDKFEANLQHESADARKKYEEARDEFQKVRKEMKKKISDLEVAGDNAWDDIKGGADEAWGVLTKAFDKASSHFKK